MVSSGNPTIAANGGGVVRPARINMRYHLTEGGTATLMVGLIIAHPRFGPVFFHAFKQKNGEQEFYDEDCPCPVDNLLVNELETRGIKLFYAYDEDSHTLYRALVSELCAAKLMSFATKTARVRRMLPRAMWVIVEDVIQSRQGRGKVLTKNLSPLFSIPWIERTETLNEA